jgi:cytochrome c-type biogenesis protein CcmH/NrfG
VGRFTRTLTVTAIAVAALVAAGLGPVLPGRGGAPATGGVPAAGASAFLRPRDASSLARSIEVLRERVTAMPGDAGAWAGLGLAYLQQARITGMPEYYPLAEGALERSLGVRPASAEALLGMATLAAAEHDFETALRLGTRMRALEPWDPNAHGIVGDALVELGRYDRAFASFQTMVDTRPDTASFSRVSYARELVGDLPGAIRAMRRARTFSGTPTDAAWTSVHLGLLLLNLGRVRPASEAFRDAAGLDPSSAQPLVGLSMVAVARDDLPRARRLIEEATSRTPSPEHAIASADLAALAGDVGAAARGYDLARVGFRLLARAGVDVTLERALFEAEHGDPRRALADARAAWARRRSMHAADAMAWALHANGRDDGAATYARRARSLGMREGLFLYHAGVIELSRRRPTEGRALLRRALEVDPWFSILGPPEARRLLREGGAS